MLPALVVVVLYQCAADKSSTLISLRAAKVAGCVPADILVVDNLPLEGNADSLIIQELGAHYLPCDVNSGVQPAYERARFMAGAAGIDWLWLWDQDSEFLPDFAFRMSSALAVVAAEDGCAGVLPRVFSASNIVSPLVGKIDLSPVEEIVRLPAEARVQAINSGMLVRRDFVDALGGFDARFWLDGLDHWLCLSARNTGWWFAVANAELDHHLSVVSNSAYVSVFRYESILRAELILFDELYSPAERVEYFFRLVFRCLKHPLRYRSLAYLKPGLKQVQRLFHRVAT